MQYEMKMSKFHFLLVGFMSIWLTLVCTGARANIDFSSYNINSTFSTNILQPDDNTVAFLTISQVELEAYLDRVVSYSNNRITFFRNKARIKTDLTRIVNYYLEEQCPEYNAIYGGFTDAVSKQISNLDLVENTSENIGYNLFMTRMEDLKISLEIELNEFIEAITDPEDLVEMTTKSKYTKLDPIDTPVLYPLEVVNVPVLDPTSGEPLIGGAKMSQAIIELLKSNNDLIALMSGEILKLNQEMLEVKREGIDYQREFKDIHSRIDGLEDAIYNIRLNPTGNVSSENTIETEDKKMVFFDKNSIAIDIEHLEMLNALSQKLKADNNLRIVVTGFADKSGNAALNNKVSRLRAQSVSEYFLRMGISQSKMLLNHLGDSRSNKESRSDRRVEIDILK
ncbi:MAG: outer membrane protein OmpA-like peptidoglycan-associated protein [Patiriisocius sp.]|jgi:outer membrane protein OmpA-like peptidoglycan-associated protein